MGFFLIKTIITAVIIAGVSELSRRFSLFAAAIASLPLISILSFIWIYTESKDVEKLINMSQDIFWLVLPSLVFFLLFPILLKQGFNFWVALLIGSAAIAFLYGITIYLLRYFSN